MIFSLRSVCLAGVAAAALVTLPVGGAALLSSTAISRPAPDSFADLAAKLLPAVVNVSSTADIKSADAGPEIPGVPPG